jgi:diguanylate cyclase (GGDEF)-like protein
MNTEELNSNFFLKFKEKVDLPSSSKAMRETALIEVESRAFLGAFVYIPCWLGIAISTGVMGSAPQYSRYITITLCVFAFLRCILHFYFKKFIAYSEVSARLSLVSLVLGAGFVIGCVTVLTMYVSELGPAFVSTVAICGVFCTAGTLILSIDPAIRYGMPVTMLGPAFLGFVCNPTTTNITLSVLVLLNLFYLLITSKRSHFDYWEGANTRSLLEKQSAFFKEQSLTDTLTQIPNRLSAQRRLSDEWDKALQNNSRFTLMILDIDHFKLINDMYGHLFGDKCLISVARALDECLRDSDFLARYGGEEFIVTLPESSENEALVIAERLRLKLSLIDLNFQCEPVYITCSIGLATVAPYLEVNDLGAAIDLADKALYQAKKTGRNRIVTSGSLDERG